MTNNQDRSSAKKEQQLEAELEQLAQKSQEEAGDKNIEDDSKKVTSKDEDKEDNEAEDDEEEESEDDEDESDEDESDEDESDDEDSEDDESEDEDEESDEDDKSKLDDDDHDDSEDDKESEIKEGDKQIPVWKHKMELKRQKQRIEAELKKSANRNDGEVDIEKEVADAVTKFKLDPEVGKEFLITIRDLTAKAIEKKFGISEDLKKSLSVFEERQREQLEERGFEQEFGKNLKTIRKLFPDAEQSQIDKLKARVKELAYTKKYANYALEDIIRLNRKTLAPATKSKSVDGHKAGTSRSSVRYDLSDPTSIPWSELSPEEFEKVSEALASRSTARSKIYRKGKRIN